MGTVESDNIWPPDEILDDLYKVVPVIRSARNEWAPHVAANLH